MDIKELYKNLSKNVMTPKILAHRIIDNKVIELSKGQDMDGNNMYAITILEVFNDYMQSDGKGELFQGKNANTKARQYYSNYKVE